MRAPLFTARLKLRDIVEADAQRMCDLDSDPEVMRHIGVAAPPDLASNQERIRTVYVPAQSHPWHGIRMVEDRESGNFLGWVFARPADQAKYAAEVGWTCASEVEVGYRFRRETWGRGIATEATQPLVEFALNDPATSAIVGCASVENGASIRVLEKLGLQRVGKVLLAGESITSVKMELRKPAGVHEKTDR